MYAQLSEIFTVDRIKFNEPMKNHTTFKIGGPVDVMVFPESQEEIIAVLAYCQERNIPFFVFGMGSNLLAKDRGVRGIAIKTGPGMKTVQIRGEKICAQAGVRLSELARVAARESLSGLEFAEGIPGSLGGAVVMNAGAYGGEIKDVLVSVTAISLDGVIKEFSPEQMQMSYRSSIFQQEEHIILSVCLSLRPGNRDEILATMKEYAGRRREKQPLDLPSAGSTFKRPEGFYVGPMLDKMGLKGFRIGDAEVSTKHAGFIVNRGNATARDVLDLIACIQEKAAREYGVELQPEIHVIGE